uniref:Uncharacterized protein LOC105638302 n=1 Tax=Rhizophora mucronata TaxID=61149 RepID=A0A2P2JWW0_RHIMU
MPSIPFTSNFSFALISCICLAASRLASKGSTMVITFFESPLLETYTTKIIANSFLSFSRHNLRKSCTFIKRKARDKARTISRLKN